MSTTRKVTIRKNSGADIGIEERINLIEGANVTLTVADDAANKEVDVTIASGAGGTIDVSKNSGAVVSTQPELNFIEGANITLTIADDAVNSECDITIAASASGEAWIDQFFPATDPDTTKGSYPSVLMPDAITTDVYHMFMIPSDIVTITTASLILLSDASGNIYWNCDTDGGACSEDFQTNTDSIASNASAMTADQIKCLDISASFTGFTGGDFVGLHFARVGGNVLDTIGDSCYYLGVLIQGSE